MPYFLRILSPRPEAVPPSALSVALVAAQLEARMTGGDVGLDWQSLVILRSDGEELCLIERNDVTAEGLGRDEIDEFIEEMEGAFPRSAAQWLSAYLPSVRTIYALQILGSVYEGDGWDIVEIVKNTIWNMAGGILQADYEGFSNEAGCHILWQFSDEVIGNWWMAVLDTGGWRKFEMDLASRAHREAFMRGEVPQGVESTY